MPNNRDNPVPDNCLWSYTGRQT